MGLGFIRIEKLRIGFGSDTNSGMIRKISNWFGMNFNPELLPGILIIIQRKHFFIGSTLNICCFVVVVSLAGNKTFFFRRVYIFNL